MLGNWAPGAAIRPVASPKRPLAERFSCVLGTTFLTCPECDVPASFAHAHTAPPPRRALSLDNHQFTGQIGGRGHDDQLCLLPCSVDVFDPQFHNPPRPERHQALSKPVLGIVKQATAVEPCRGAAGFEPMSMHNVQLSLRQRLTIRRFPSVYFPSNPPPALYTSERRRLQALPYAPEDPKVTLVGLQSRCGPLPTALFPSFTGRPCLDPSVKAFPAQPVKNIPAC